MHIQQFRQALAYSQEDLAQRLQFPLSDIIKWEEGTTSPTICQLRDMALLFKTSVEELRGDYPLRIYPRTGHFFVNDSTLDAFWGHLCIYLQKSKEALWFPISLKSRRSIAEQLAQSTESAPWIAVETINNRLLFANVMQIDSIELINQYKETRQTIPDNGDLQGHSLELYRALMFKDQDLFGYIASDQYSDHFKAEVESIVEHCQLYNTPISDLLYNTHLYQTHSLLTAPIAPQVIIETYRNVINHSLPLILNISESLEGNQWLIPSHNIALINTPLAPVIDYGVSQKVEDLLI